MSLPIITLVLREVLRCTVSLVGTGGGHVDTGRFARGRSGFQRANQLPGHIGSHDRVSHVRGPNDLRPGDQRPGRLEHPHFSLPDWLLDLLGWYAKLPGNCLAIWKKFESSTLSARRATTQGRQRDLYPLPEPLVANGGPFFL